MDAALLTWIAHADVDFVIGVVGPVFADQDAVRDQLHRGADGLCTRPARLAISRLMSASHSIPGSGRVSDRGSGFILSMCSRIAPVTCANAT